MLYLLIYTLLLTIARSRCLRNLHSKLEYSGHMIYMRI
jgi:hypothetical protein